LLLRIKILMTHQIIFQVAKTDKFQTVKRPINSAKFPKLFFFGEKSIKYTSLPSPSTLFRCVHIVQTKKEKEDFSFSPSVSS
jgi:hypothetical protein